MGNTWHPLAHSTYTPLKLILHMLCSVAASFAIFATLGNVISLPETYGKLLFVYFMKHLMHLVFPIIFELPTTFSYGF
jgi:hypothetical protein